MVRIKFFLRFTFSVSYKNDLQDFNSNSVFNAFQFVGGLKDYVGFESVGFMES